MKKYFAELQDLNTIDEGPETDKKKLKLLSTLLTINKNYHVQKNYKPDINFPRMNQINNERAYYRHGSFSLSNIILPKKSKISSIFSKKKICNPQTDKEDEEKLIKFAFYKIIEENCEDHQGSTNSELYLPYFVQFLINCYVVSQHFMSLFMLPFSKKKSIDLDSFILSLEVIQQMSFEKASFFYNENDVQFKKNIAIQKMICKAYIVFFKFVEYCCGLELDENDLGYVLNLALRNNKKSPDCKELVKNTFNKLEKMNQGQRKTFIKFEEFYKILIN
jgi:hypothetical protein